MLEIQQYIAPINQFTRPNIKLNSVKGIVAHWTATPQATASNIARYFAHTAPANGTYASAQFAVDESNIIQCIPDDEMAYAVGSNTYTQEALNRLSSYPNNCTISIEMCVDANGQIKDGTFQNAADLVAYLLKKYNLTINDIWTHRGIVGWKDCPRPWTKYDGNGKPIGDNAEFDRFKKLVQQKLNPNPDFVVYQWKNKLQEFADQNDAINFAKQWDHSYIIRKSNGEWLWNTPDWTNDDFAKLKGQNQTQVTKEDVLNMISKYFKDVQQQWVAESADRCYERGIVKGDGQGDLLPNNSITRAEVVVLIDRAVEFVLGKLNK